MTELRRFKIVVNRRTVSLMAIALAWVIAPSCANGELGESFQRSIAADPRLAEDSGEGDATLAAGSCSDDVLAQLPQEFPIELCYPNAELLNVSAPSQAEDAIQTEWTTDASISDIQTYYRDVLDAESWEITGDSVAENTQEISAAKGGDRLILRFANASDASQTTSEAEDTTSSQLQSVAQTEFIVEFQPNGVSLSGRSPYRPQQASNSDESSDNPTRLTPEDARLFSQTDPDNADSALSTRSSSGASRSQSQSAASFTDLDQAPEELRPYLEDLAALGILTGTQRNAENAEGSAANRSVSSSTAFKPNETITRQEYAQWLLTANNLFYGDRPSRKIRPAMSSTSTAFQDVSPSNPRYAAIQGLADAGLIPSSLSGDTAVNFRPTAPLTREDLIRWKVPLDRRGALPNTTLSAVEEAWGFQDAEQITPAALPMVFADYENGDQSNILRAFGYTTLFQPQKAVTRAEAAAVLWHFGYQADGISADELGAN